MKTHRTGNRMLLGSSAALLVAVALHGIDHSLQERGVGALTTEVFIGGIVNAVVAVVAFVMALRDHPRAAGVAAFVGTYLAVGVSAAHFAPHWSALSDPYADLNLGFVSWAAAIAEVATAAVLAAVGFAALRQRRFVGQAAPG